mmetsp:Transcript_36933/g.89708  ORF Transcript_36933/g.89708 Transcript_36933/m.89708 type:complete len:85 (+) Transcript_36933:1079-1333(+)
MQVWSNTRVVVVDDNLRGFTCQSNNSREEREREPMDEGVEGGANAMRSFLSRFKRRNTQAPLPLLLLMTTSNKEEERGSRETQS